MDKKTNEPIVDDAYDYDSRFAPTNQESPDFILDVRSIVVESLKRAWIIPIFTIVGLYMGIQSAHEFVPKYQATMIIAPRAQSGVVSSQTQATGLKNVVSLLAGNSGGGGNALLDRMRLLMGSQQLAKKLDEKYGMLRTVYAGQWDADKGEWRKRSEDDLTWREKVDQDLNVHGSLPPGPEALARYVGGVLVFDEIKETSFLTVKVEHEDRDRALELLQQVYWAADELLREQDKVKTLERISYLQSRIEATSIAGLRTALTSALVSAEQNAHLMSGGLPYAADVIDPPFVSDMKTKPSLIKVVAAPAVIATALGILLVLLYVVFRMET
jgi:hypothetical protein